MTHQDRRRIAAGLAGRLTYAEIARQLARPTSTISREIARNGGPGGYEPERAHRATARRARRGGPVSAPVSSAATVDAAQEKIIELAVRSGLPRTIARVHMDLLMSETGTRTAAELSRRLEISPASVSASVNFLIDTGYVRRERDPRRRRDRYVVDDQAWYHAVVISSRQTLETARAALAAAATIAPDDPVGRRLSKAGTFLERVMLDSIESADRSRSLLT
ncbi:MarR family transcriptional regulator [Catenuloplanes atrovinosus]|uniref:Transcriptional regulator n=1 Tax=Catenuloplanes atrovinosus TaxID=137266 RepID=A0AAE3YZK5_9ACTN|nr:MarR family transcriptional regulator [Catenuloplanes atrovinosus]MDR7281064.1 putative transcriptional regulator [Catenuloplanes atrovinosus]